MQILGFAARKERQLTFITSLSKDPGDQPLPVFLSVAQMGPLPSADKESRTGPKPGTFSVLVVQWDYGRLVRPERSDRTAGRSIVARHSGQDGEGQNDPPNCPPTSVLLVLKNEVSCMAL
jgi:hypothetical protein